MINIIIVVLFFFTSLCLGSEKICYIAEYLFFDVAKVCIKYKVDKNTLYTKIDASTEGVVRLFKNIRYTGYSLAKKEKESIKCYLFVFEQIEKNLNIKYEYLFKENLIVTKKIKNGVKSINKFNIKLNHVLDPFSASYILFNKDLKEIFIFFEGKINRIPVKVFIEKDKKIMLLDVRDVRAEGILKPTGKWVLIFKKEDKYPEEIIAKIRIGKIKLKREK